MKVVISILITFAILLGVLTIVAKTMDEPEASASPTYEPVIIDWEEELIAAVRNDDYDRGEQAGELLGVSYTDLVNLSRIMAAESGPEWPDCYMMMIGEVVLNRVASPDWPDTIWGVLSQREPTQYAPVWMDSWGSIKPSENTIRLALRLLRGERVLNDELVIYQALFPQGEQTVATYWDEHLNTTTYFCRE